MVGGLCGWYLLVVWLVGLIVCCFVNGGVFDLLLFGWFVVSLWSLVGGCFLLLCDCLCSSDVLLWCDLRCVCGIWVFAWICWLVTWFVLILFRGLLIVLVTSLVLTFVSVNGILIGYLCWLCSRCCVGWCLHYECLVFKC